MILEELRLNNFCLFRGSQVVDLSPGQRGATRKPIVLFGGMNGGGKTTVFDAIQLALYGSRAKCSKRVGRSYDDFLRDSINTSTRPEDGAGVALAFRITTNGEAHRYEVRREWRVQDGKVKEDLVVLRDGTPDHSAARQWSQLVEELIPIEIAQIFFFDGEKIRALAEDATSSETLGTAIRALLGLDIVERLIADASVLQARLTKLAGDPEERAVVEGLERVRDACRVEVERVVAERASLQNHWLRAEVAKKAAEERFALVGGKHWEERQAREKRLAEVAQLGKEISSQLESLAASELPLVLVTNLLEGVARQDAQERASVKASFVSDLLEERDETVLKKLKAESEFPKDVLGLVAALLADDRKARSPRSAVERRLSFSDATHAQLGHIRETRLRELQEEAAKLLDRLQQATKEKEDIERLLAATPNDADVGKVVTELKAATEEFARLDEQAKALDADVAARRAELSAAEEKLVGVLQKDLHGKFEQEDSAKMAELAGRSREIMKEFLRRATEKKIDRLSEYITDGFRFLLRKGTLVERIQIDPSTFAVTLYERGGKPLSRDRLSEGEKQIFAISMLWGLARASSRPLPAVIDTPMARLDSAHRTHLVERYFPQASHQVIVLSTDTEVDQEYYDMLRPAIARTYHLNYDELEGRTVAEEGYFWKN